MNNMLISHKTRAFGARTLTFGGLLPPKVGGHPNLAEKFGSRHKKILENALITSLCVRHFCGLEAAAQIFDPLHSR